MKRPLFILPACAVLLWLCAGCASMFPRTETTTISRWASYQDVLAAFNEVVPGQTTVNDLVCLGFTPDASPNVHVLNYIDVINRFMPNPSITKADLPEPVRQSLEHKERTTAYELDLSNIRTKRSGNLFLDMTSFKRVTHTTGWRFKALLLVEGDKVVYKISSSDPSVDDLDKKVKPLGPFQEIEGVVVSGAQAVK